MASGELKDKQRVFCEEYLKDLNATQAAIRAGYSKKTANEQGSRLLVNVSIQEKIQQLMDERSGRTQVTADMVVKELARIGFSDMQSFATWDSSGVQIKDSKELNEDESACVAEVSESITAKSRNIKFKLHDKKGALDSLCRHLGMFTENVQHTVRGLVGVFDASQKSDEELEELIGDAKKGKA